eukprot:IDg20270t1
MLSAMLHSHCAHTARRAAVSTCAITASSRQSEPNDRAHACALQHVRPDHSFLPRGSHGARAPRRTALLLARVRTHRVAMSPTRRAEATAGGKGKGGKRGKGRRCARRAEGGQDACFGCAAKFSGSKRECGASHRELAICTKSAIYRTLRVTSVGAHDAVQNRGIEHLERRLCRRPFRRRGVQ